MDSARAKENCLQMSVKHLSAGITTLNNQTILRENISPYHLVEISASAAVTSADRNFNFQALQTTKPKASKKISSTLYDQKLDTKGHVISSFIFLDFIQNR